MRAEKCAPPVLICCSVKGHSAQQEGPRNLGDLQQARGSEEHKVPVVTSVTRTARKEGTPGSPGLVDVSFQIVWEEKRFAMTGSLSVETSSVGEAVSATQTTLKDLCPLLLDELSAVNLSPV